MNEKASLENAICRAAIVWERAPESEKVPAEETLRATVQEYMGYIISSSLPVEAVPEVPEKPEVQYDAGVFVRPKD